MSNRAASRQRDWEEIRRVVFLAWLMFAFIPVAVFGALDLRLATEVAAMVWAAPVMAWIIGAISVLLWRDARRAWSGRGEPDGEY